jgi:hypothetical protein
MPEIIISNDSICPNAKFTVTIQNPEEGISFKAINNGVWLPGTYQSSNGTPIQIELTANTPGIGINQHHFAIQAFKTNTCTTYYDYYYDSILVIRPAPDVDMFVPYDTICSGAQASSHLIFQVLNSEEDFSYCWRWQTINLSDFLPGNGNTLTFDHGTISPGVRTYYLETRHNSLYCGSEFF